MPNETQVLMKSPETAINLSPWRMRFVPDAELGRNAGECSFEEQQILLANSLPVVALVGAICHEVTHLSCPDLGEDAVLRVDENVTAALFACPRLKITLAEGMDG